MKQKTITALIAALTLTTLTACGGPQQLSKSVTVELGDEKGIKVTDVLDISKDDAKNAKINTKDVNFYKTGSYDATITYDKKDYKLTVKIKDTTAPEVTVKDDIVVQTGNAVRVTDCIDTVDEASGIIDAKFETKPEVKETDTTESTESVSTTDTTESTEAASSSVYAVDGVSLSSNDEITYTTPGDYDNNIIVTDTNGNETTVAVKISVIDAPSINGVADKSVTVGDTIDYMAGVTATDGKGEDLTGSVEVDSSEVKTDAAGTYKATYKVTDKHGLTSGAVSNVTVNEPAKEEPAQVADNSDSNSGSSKSDKKNNSSSSSSKKNNSSSSSSGSSSSSSSSGGSSSSGSSSSGATSGGSGSSGSGSGGSAETPKQDDGDYVLIATGEKIKVNRSAWKYDTSYASSMGKHGLWANGDYIDVPSTGSAFASGTLDKDAAKYMVAAGIYDQWVYDEIYGE